MFANCRQMLNRPVAGKTKLILFGCVYRLDLEIQLRFLVYQFGTSVFPVSGFANVCNSSNKASSAFSCGIPPLTETDPSRGLGTGCLCKLRKKIKKLLSANDFGLTSESRNRSIKKKKKIYNSTQSSG